MRTLRHHEAFSTDLREGHSWERMAISCRYYSERDMYTDVLIRRNLSHQMRKKTRQFDPSQYFEKVMKLRAYKSEEASLVALAIFEHGKKKTPTGSLILSKRRKNFRCKIGILLFNKNSQK